jgi:hypothetical protein
MKNEYVFHIKKLKEARRLCFGSLIGYTIGLGLIHVVGRIAALCAASIFSELATASENIADLKSKYQLCHNLAEFCLDKDFTVSIVILMMMIASMIVFASQMISSAKKEMKNLSNEKSIRDAIQNLSSDF